MDNRYKELVVLIGAVMSAEPIYKFSLRQVYTRVILDSKKFRVPGEDRPNLRSESRARRADCVE